MKVLITGMAGFIGFHTARLLIANGIQVVGIDNLNDNIGDRQLKLHRLGQLGVNISDAESIHRAHGCEFQIADISSSAEVDKVFDSNEFDAVLHFAAQAGVRYSLKDPAAYIQSNLVGFGNIMEACRTFGVRHIVYASSSSIYGNSAEVPFAEGNVDYRPVSVYAATKQSNEHLAYAYSHIYGIRTTGLRFFTVYGPWGREDMAYTIFAESMLAGKPIKIFNHGTQSRDFTYIDDVVDILPAILSKTDWRDPLLVPANVYNIGSSSPVQFMDFIETLEQVLGVKAEKQLVDGLSVDVDRTYADSSKAAEAFGFKPSCDLNSGLKEFVKWYTEYRVNRQTAKQQLQSL